jgi:hypothetical protein
VKETQCINNHKQRVDTVSKLSQVTGCKVSMQGHYADSGNSGCEALHTNSIEVNDTWD